MSGFVKRIVGNITASLVSVVVVLVMFEIGVRILDPQRTESLHNMYYPDAQYGWTFIPDLSRKVTAADFSITIETNNRGFRGPIHFYEKAPGTYRILGLGDSMLFGWGIEYDETVLSYLAGMMGADDRWNGTEVEAVNLGIPGYNTDQYKELLINEGPKYRPDLVIVLFYPNDLSEKPGYEYSGVRKDGFLKISEESFSLKSIRGVLYPLRLWLKRYSQAYMFTRSRLKGFLMRAGLMAIPKDDLYRKDDKFAERYAHTFDNIAFMSRFCREQLGCDFLLLISPEKMQVRKSLHEIVKKSYDLSNDSYDWRQYQSVLSQYCRSHDIPYLDLTQALQEDAAVGKKTFLDVDWHWNVEGHRIAAQEVYHYLIKP